MEDGEVDVGSFPYLTYDSAEVVYFHQPTSILIKLKFISNRIGLLNFWVVILPYSHIQYTHRTRMRIKESAVACLSALLALFIYLYQFLTSFIFVLSARLHLLNATNHRISRSQSRLKGEDGGSVYECIHIIANSSISLMLAYGVLHYHQIFVELIVLVTHHVHHWFLRLIADIPDLSSFIRSSYAIKLFLCYLYLIFGYLGISAQLVLTVDLIYLCNLPTIFLYKFLAKAYKFLVKYFWMLVELLSKTQKQWLSCPYPSWLLKDSLKVVYISCLPIFGFFMIVVGFYYIWLAFVIITLKVAMNIGINISIAIDQLGFFICVLKGICQRLQIEGNTSKWQIITAHFQSLEWVNMLELTTFFQVFKGNDLLAQQTNKNQLDERKSFKEIYRTLTSMIR